MRVPLQAALAAFLTLSALPPMALAQPAAQTPRGPADLPAAETLAPVPDGLRIEWEVKNRFRLFRNEADFQRHVAATRGDGVLATEQRLSRASDGRGWARDMVENLCIDQSGRVPESCQRDGEKENYLAPSDHRVGVIVAGNIMPGALCGWSFDDGEGPVRSMTLPCTEEVTLRVRYGAPTVAAVDIGLADGTAQRVTANIQVQDFLIAGLGDSIAAGEGNPDRPIALDDGGFCFRRFLGGSFSEYFRPGRSGFRGNKACDPALSAPGGNTAQDWARLNARWMNAACHRSLYGYQIRAALALAVEQPHAAVTFLPLACSGSSIEQGVFGSLRARECPPRGNCSTSTTAQMKQLTDALALARKQQPQRKLDLVLLTVGANDIMFSGLVGDVIIEDSTERTLFRQGGAITTVPEAEKILNNQLPGNFAKLRAALKPLAGGNLSRVVYVTYGNPTLAEGGVVCPGGRGGFDVHPAFNADPQRLRGVADFVQQKFLPRMRALATCEGSGACRDPNSERMTFVDSHQAEFANHGFCARSSDDPVFDRQCFLDNGESFEANPATGANDPMVCNMRARDYRAYAPRARWIRTANDSYFTAMTYPEGISSALQPSDLHDATWGATSAVYGGAIHPTAEGHAAMADAAIPAMRALLDLPSPAQVRAEPLAPLQIPLMPATR